MTGGAFALHKATKEFNLTQREYQKALRRFCDFILDGKVAPEDS